MSTYIFMQCMNLGGLA